MVPPITLLPEERIPEQAEPLGPGQLLDQGQKPFPLRALAVRAHLTGPLASVEVSQRFANPHAEPIEAVYIFPLPSGASVYRFRMKVADRVVEGEVQERQRARQTYDEGLKAGHRAALLEQERDNVFTVTLGNLPPGEEVTIEMAYAGRMEVHETETTFRFPLVVAPRYIPGEPVDGGSVGRGTSPDTDQVPDASRLTPPLLLPGLTTGASLDISVRLECAGLPPSRLACSQHVVSQRTEGGDLVIELARGDELLNRDFVLRYQTGGEQPQALLLADEGHFLLQVLPPRQAPAAAFKRDLVFVLDRSGSMSGAKIASAQAALVRFLRRLGPDDRFAILAFDNSVESYRGGKMCGVSEVEEACRWVQRVGARGGTEILEPIRQVLNRRLEEGRLTAAVVLTDGQVGNEPAIYKMVAEARSPVRLFTLGLDTAVNDAFLRRLAQLGRGTCELVTPGEKLEAALERLERETHSPLVTDLELVDCGLGFVPDSLVPERLPDLFAARPVTVVGRKTGPGG
ncbi:MAG TPA: VIT domain-containing protein, partial [Candidatus Nitrosotenuis sp.]|nr:VIT domain-containing protein [Candidatus Nitrosotenuis sp.]